MLQKLYSLVSGQISEDNPDSMQFQECLLPGYLYGAIIKEKLMDLVYTVKMTLQNAIKRSPNTVDLQDRVFLKKQIARGGFQNTGDKLAYFLSTGNLVSNTGLDLQQTTGFTIVAEKLNRYRYLSHFRSIHRGSFFAELKTTTVRKLLPESWGFLCPVHTPDGSPCGLLNHLSQKCEVTCENVNVSGIIKALCSLGAHEMDGKGPRVVNGELQSVSCILLDGKVIGWALSDQMPKIAEALRHYKIQGKYDIPLKLEIGHVPISHKGQYHGLYLFSTPARFTRPVTYLATNQIDYVSPFEQVYMNIACTKESLNPGLTTHMELSPTSMLSVIASLTPFSDFNQSPRNMYQCQMGKQSMGTPMQNIFHRTDNKLYRLQTGQSPIVRPQSHVDYKMDEYPNGMNAVVCVISYTGYDMEDASIISKSSYERGYGYGTIYKVEWVDLLEKNSLKDSLFGFRDNDEELCITETMWEKIEPWIDVDGLPKVGVKVAEDDPIYAITDNITKRVKIVKYKGETAYIDQVRLIGTDKDYLTKISIKYRIPRPPIIGDKFSSRHGQKGVISQKWPTIDMPFSSTGIIPDVIINPHAFPSRMTIGMFIESLAGKAGALHGHFQDATPFQYDEKNTPADYFGHQLLKAGFNYHGNEEMYSGITGEPFKASIYQGVVFYQRLRHMVSDKYQVRTTGPVDQVTQQPVKGRKKMGGIRFGEMERDSLLAHGVSFLLQDRLLNCSDYARAKICVQCGSILTVYGPDKCSSCQKGDVKEIAIPFVLRYLITELVAMNVKLFLTV